MMNQSNSGNHKSNRRVSNNCHQCHKNDKGQVVRCNKCGKQYCVPCITRRYPTMDETSFAEACAICLSICNCGSCLKAKVNILITTAAIPAAQDVEGGIMCDVFGREDVPKLEDYLKKRTVEFGHTLPLHHSSMNVAVDLVPPGSSHLTEERWTLPQNHAQKEDNLQVKKMTPHEAHQAMEDLDKITRSDSAAEKPSHESMKQQLELMKSYLERVGPILPPEKREMLRGEIRGFVKKFFPNEGSSSSSRPHD